MARRPDYRAAAMNKKTDEKGNIGAAWLNEDGTIQMVLNPFVRLEPSKDLVITLFPEKTGDHYPPPAKE